MTDLILRGGRILDPGQNLDQVADVGFTGAIVSSINKLDTPDASAEIRDVTGKIVVPGLIDFHTHVYWGGTSLSVDAALVAARSGTTTFVDGGSAGAGSFAGFLRHVIEQSPVRILSFLNISYPGIYGFSRSVMVGEAGDWRLLDVGEAVRVVRENRDCIAGIKVRIGRVGSENNGLSALDAAFQAADACGVPVMVHIDFPPPDIDHVVSRLRPGDILTHAWRPFPNSLLQGNGKVRAAVVAAGERGVLFDIGHGMGGFSFEVARRLLELGWEPDIISSDVHTLSFDGPAYDVLVTMSKLLCLGLPLAQVIRAVTATPAHVLRREDIGRLAVGAAGDAAVLELVEGEFAYADAGTQILRGTQRLRLAGMVVAGQWWDAAPQPSLTWA